MTIDQDVETLREQFFGWPERGEANAALDRILARITELEGYLKGVSRIEGQGERIRELEEGLRRMAEMKYFDDADASAAWYIARSLLGDAEQ